MHLARSSLTGIVYMVLANLSITINNALIKLAVVELPPMQAMFQEALLSSPASRIAGGTDEILRNIIAERVLNLPGDIRVDKDIPFNRLASGKR